MIGFIQGILIHKEPNLVLVQVGGTAFELDISLNTFNALPEEQQEVQLHTHLYVREEILQLLGFISVAEKQLFRKLIKVSGIGPKAALSILSAIMPDEFVFAVLANDHAKLTRVPGIGKKSAERLIIEMRDSLRQWQAAPQSAGEKTRNTSGGHYQVQQEVQAALNALGYKLFEIERVLAKLTEKTYNSSEELLREALQSLG